MNIFYVIFIYPLTQIIEFVFVFAQNLFKETGLSIICVSAAVSILSLPLYMVAEKWQGIERNIQKRLALKIIKIKSVFKGDERHMMLSTYYRQNHYHPVYVMRSTFGLLIQIPFFIAAYSCLSGLEALRGIPFLFIKDLGRADGLIPIAGGINLLPMLMTIINCLAGAIYTKGFAIKDKSQLYAVALFFLILLYASPSGLLLYWTLNNVFSLLKNIYLKIISKTKRFFLCGIISVSSCFLSYYALFLLHGNVRVRILISLLFIMIGLLPWTVSPLITSLGKILYIHWTKKESLLLFTFSVLTLWTITGIFLPSILISASPQEFSFVDNIRSPLNFILNTVFQSFGLLVAWPFMIYFLFSEKTKKTLSLLAAILSLSALMNIFFFSGDYGPISNNLIFSDTVSHNLSEVAHNFFILAIIFILVVIIYLKGFKRILFSVLAILLFAISSFSAKLLHSIDTEYKSLSTFYVKEKKDEGALPQLFQLSKNGKNVIVLMLDMAESAFIPYIFNENPQLNSRFEGFIYYPNTVTFNGWTLGGAPPIFGGYDYTPEGLNSRSNISLLEKTDEALKLMPTLFSMSGFSVFIADPPYAGGSWIPDLRIYNGLSDVNASITDGVYTDHWLNNNNIVLPQHSEVLKRNILWYAIFRESPLAFRQGIYYKGSWCASFSENRMRLFINGYAVLDYLSELTGFEPKNNNTAVFITNNTTHERWFSQAPLYKPQLNVNDYGNSRFSREDWYHSNAAAIHRLADYFEFLRFHDVYDNTRIILVSDHGVLDNTFVTKTSLPFHIDQFNPILLIKDFHAKGELKTDTIFMSTADVPALAMNDIIENPVNPFNNNTVSSDRKKDPLLILVQRVQEYGDNLIDLNPRNTFYVKDSIFDVKNWQKPEKIP
jgi:membrane protein insertase Oxa1/YidC/SpoIIIJ